MPRKPKAYVLDSWAVLSYFHDEPAGEQVENIIADAREDGIPLFISVVNAAEVWYITARRRSEADADSGIHVLREFGVHFVEADWTLAKEAGRFKAKHRMSFADCFAAALAKTEKLTGSDRKQTRVRFRRLDSTIFVILGRLAEPWPGSIWLLSPRCSDTRAYL